MVLPPRCGACGSLGGSPHSLCSHCWQKLTFISSPCCEKCSLPQPFESEIGGSCSCPPQHFEKGRAAVVYNAASRDLLLAFKHADHPEHAPMLASLIRSAAGEMLSECSMLVPIPLHWTRMFTRKYNQAALLTAALSKSSGIPWQPLLKRPRRTKMQGHQNRLARYKNLHGAFAPRQNFDLSGQMIGVIDDVWTTGATFQEAARVLKAMGAKEVRVFAVARAIPEH